MIHIDGAAGEGGGQILRSALGLSLITGQPFQIDNIRANRKKPGLMRQHLTAVRAAAEIGRAEVRGDEIGSMRLAFSPGAVQPGRYRFAIGTAGSCTLVLQTVLPALLAADSSSEIVLEGGTHNPMAPPYDFLKETFLPLLSRMGAKVETDLVRPGFYPAGGGCLRVTVQPAGRLSPFELVQPPAITFAVRAVCAQLPVHICERELHTVQTKLGVPDAELESVRLDKFGPGNVLSIFARSQELTETFTGFGEKNVSAEKVALRAVKLAREYRDTGAPVGPFLADQLLIPLALAGAGRFRTCRPTQHTLTNIEVLRRFLDCRFKVKQVAERVWEIAL